MAQLCFKLNLPYLQSAYSVLRPIAISVKNLGKSEFEWVFNLSDIETVIKVLGKTFEFSDAEIERLIPYAPMLKKTVPDKSRKKGQGYFIVTHRFPKMYICESIINAKVVKHKVPTENIEVAWNVIKKHSKEVSIKSKTIAENILKELNIDRFDRESGSFDWAKFFGNRADYYRYFYMPMKILESEGAIIHHKDGHIQRCQDHWELQAVLEMPQ